MPDLPTTGHLHTRSISLMLIADIHAAHGAAGVLARREAPAADPRPRPRSSPSSSGIDETFKSSFDFTEFCRFLRKDESLNVSEEEERIS